MCSVAFQLLSMVEALQRIVWGQYILSWLMIIYPPIYSASCIHTSSFTNFMFVIFINGQLWKVLVRKTSAEKNCHVL